MKQFNTIVDGVVPESRPNLIFRARRYPSDFPAFADKTLVPGEQVLLEHPDFGERDISN